MNLLGFILMGADKRKARLGKWRIPEKTLILLALFMGGTGALLGMGGFPHKTLHKKFSIGVPLLTLLNYAVIGGVMWLIYRG